jgi:2-methylisocitrate lyase-like PEP mutase family enzyme
MTKTIERFRRLHAGNELLVLPNCWDAGSARLIESLGAKALATTSAGVAWAQGYPDGDRLPVENLVAVARSIARVISVPLSVDFEGGYSNDPASVADAALQLIDAGVVGINLEDGGSPPELLAAKIEHIKRAAAKAGAELFINARTDVYLAGLAPAGAARVAETLARAKRYRDAGADGLFVPALVAEAEIKEISAGAGLPLNVLAWAGLPEASQLFALGVRRLSAGSSICQSAWGHVATAVTSLLRDGNSAPAATAMKYPDLQALFPRE